MITLKRFLGPSVFIAIPFLSFIAAFVLVLEHLGLTAAEIPVGVSALGIFILLATAGARCPYVRRGCLSLIRLCSWGSGADLSPLDVSSAASFRQTYANTRLEVSQGHLFRAITGSFYILAVLLPLLLIVFNSRMDTLTQRLHVFGKLMGKLELGAVVGSMILMTLAFLSQPPEKRGSIRGVIFALKEVVYFGLLLALVPLLKPFRSWMSDPNSFHIEALVVCSCLALVYDISVHFSVEETEQRELREICMLLDLPIVVSSVMLLYFWRYKHAEAEAAELDGFLAGALVMQLLISAWLFSIIRSGLHRRRMPVAESETASKDMSQAVGAGGGI